MFRGIIKFAAQSARQHRAQSGLAVPNYYKTKQNKRFKSIEENLKKFEEKVQLHGVAYSDILCKNFNLVTQFVTSYDTSRELRDAISVMLTKLLRCCGNIMLYETQKSREAIAGNLWLFMKEYKLVTDIAHYNSLLKVFCDNKTQIDPKLILDEITAANLTPNLLTYQRLIHLYCLQGDIAGAISMLETMKALNFELTEQIFSSLIIGYSKQENAPSVHEIFDLMRSNNIEPGCKSFAAAYQGIASRLSENPDAVNDLEKLHSLSIEQEITYQLDDLVNIIVSLAPQLNNKRVASVANQFTNIISINAGLRAKLIGNLCRIKEYKLASALYWSLRPAREVNSEKIEFSYIFSLISPGVPIEFAIGECLKMKEKNIDRYAILNLYYAAARFGRLDIVRRVLKLVQEEGVRKPLIYWPLIVQSKSKDELLQVLKDDLGPSWEDKDLIRPFALWVWPRFENNARELIEVVKKLGFNESLIRASYIHFVSYYK